MHQRCTGVIRVNGDQIHYRFLYVLASVTSQIMFPRFTMFLIGNKIVYYLKKVIIEYVTMFSFQRYHFHFGTLTEKDNVILRVDRTRVLSISLKIYLNVYHRMFEKTLLKCVYQSFSSSMSIWFKVNNEIIVIVILTCRLLEGWLDPDTLRFQSLYPKVRTEYF